MPNPLTVSEPLIETHSLISNFSEKIRHNDCTIDIIIYVNFVYIK